MINERGSVLPITLILILIAIFAVGHAASSYVSQYRYISEIRQFYKKEIHQQLIAGKKAGNESLERDMFQNSHFAPESGNEVSAQNDRESGSIPFIEDEKKEERSLSNVKVK
ncbi:hypothetical protein [Bacillus norwichensis]|uniref:Uncharacterized protein n=1 Tax=Bacillus norwichensis TaxID=2762217 RepID=A0ABR8VFK4_9BACI|nr:hypothetical protein [Bacillus norwichensis]MBD8003556.1 hypothetical protein [Bacillus norwichensis]